MIRTLSALFLVLLVAACDSGKVEVPEAPVPDETAGESANRSVDLSPSSWPPEELQAYLGTAAGEPLPDAPGIRLQATGRNGIVAATSGAFAVHAGMQAMKQGGSAVDAALTVALAQVALHMGGATSYAGQLAMMVYDAASGEVHALDAGYATVMGETDPLSIPPYGTPSGRAVMVPGFMAGIEAAHERYGRLPFAELFEPAIFLAENGFRVAPNQAAMMQQRKHVLTRLPAGRALFLKEDGTLPAAGDMVTQPEVAGFLRRAADQGRSAMYTGPWAEQFVAAVRAEGGAMTLADLENYRALWFPIAPARIRGFEVYASANMVEKLRLAELADLRSRGHYSESAEALYWLMQISRVNGVLGPHMIGSGLPADELEAAIPGLKVSWPERYTDDMAATIWAAMQTPAWADLSARAEAEQVRQSEVIANLIKDFRVRKDDENEDGSRPDHTAGIAVIDSDGNIASVVHSVTSAVWGEVGIFVEGVSVVDPAAFAQHTIQHLEPGEHMSTYGEGDGIGACPAIVTRDGKPVLGCGNVGASFDVVAQQGLVNVIEYGLEPNEIRTLPMFRKNWPPGQPVRQPVGPGEFSREILEAVRQMGIDIVAVDDPSQATHGGVWVVGASDPAKGEMSGAVTAGSHSRISASDGGLVEAY